MRALRRCFRLALICLMAVWCLQFAAAQSSPEAGVQLFTSPPFPSKLSAWRIFVRKDGQLQLNAGVLPYTLVNPLFSDYALKFRTLWLPPGQKIIYGAQGELTYPVGTILSKTFAYPREKLHFPQGTPPLAEEKVGGHTLPLAGLYRMETRLLVHSKNGWIALPYQWEPSQEDAQLKLIGAKVALELELDDAERQGFLYQIPNMNQCKSCHVRHEGFDKPILPIGPKKARNLNRSYPYLAKEENQLLYWQEAGLLEGLPPIEQVPKLPALDDHAAGVEERARAYLDINCAHCHNRQGPANTSGLYLNLETRDPAQWGLCKSPVAIGNAGGGRKFDIVPGAPEASILYYRLESRNPAVMMPELGRSLVHQQGLELIARWIGGLQGNCRQPEDGT